MAIERVEQIYSSYSGVYDLFFDTILHPGRKRAVEAMSIQPGDQILEVGVGTGLSLPLYPPHGRVTGIDISRAMLRQAEEKIREHDIENVDLKQMSAERLVWPDSHFDKVLLPYVISCLERPVAVMQEVRRVCKPDGRVYFLNHFHSRNRILAWGEKRLTPLSKRLGFVLDLPLAVVTGSGLFRVEAIERVNFPRLWSLVTCRAIPDR